MSGPRCVVVGTGRMAGGFIAPTLADTGWQTLLVGRDRTVSESIARTRGLWLRLGSRPDRWIPDVSAVAVDDEGLAGEVERADLIATAVGPVALDPVGRWLAPLLRARLEAGRGPLNVVTFENHRRAPELLAQGLIAAEPGLAAEIGRTLGIAGAVTWRAIAHRSVAADGVHYEADEIDEACVDGTALVAGVPPFDGSLPALGPAAAFDDRMVEKLWLFNAGHATAAYLGWLAGCPTVDAAMARPGIAASVRAVVAEAQLAFAGWLDRRPCSVPIAARPIDSILGRYADPTLRDSVRRVGREPRRKLAPDDRFVGPATACLAVGSRPAALVAAIAAALRYADPDDRQAVDLQRELALDGPSEVLATASGLSPADELSRLVVDAYRASAPADGQP